MALRDHSKQRKSARTKPRSTEKKLNRQSEGAHNLRICPVAAASIANLRRLPYIIVNASFTARSLKTRNFAFAVRVIHQTRATEKIGRLAVEYWQPKESKKVMRMRKTLLAIVATATLALASVAVPQDAQAHGRRVVAGIIGGLAAGAILGAAASQGPYYYGPGPYYYGPGPVYYAPDCYWTHERWWNGWRWRWRRVRLCN